jgi:hypothetical protein
LALHAQRHCLQVQISKLVAVSVIDLLELIEIDVDQTEDVGILTCLCDLPIKMLVERESVVSVSEQVELRTVMKFGVEASRFNG